MRKWKCIEVGNRKEWTVGKIYETENDGNGLVSNTGSIGWVQPWNIMLVEDTGAKFEEVKQFTKGDLKPCMVVELRDGRLGRIEEVEDGLAICVNSETDWNGMEYYSNEMIYTSLCGHSWDIMKVFGFSRCGSKRHLFSTEHRELLWERIEKSPKELKIEQLQLKLDEIKSEMEQLKGE